MVYSESDLTIAYMDLLKVNEPVSIFLFFVGKGLSFCSFLFFHEKPLSNPKYMFFLVITDCKGFKKPGNPNMHSKENTPFIMQSGTNFLTKLYDYIRQNAPVLTSKIWALSGLTFTVYFFA